MRPFGQKRVRHVPRPPVSPLGEPLFTNHSRLKQLPAAPTHLQQQQQTGNRLILSCWFSGGSQREISYFTHGEKTTSTSG